MSAVATPVGVSFAPLVERKFGDRAVPEGRPAHDVPTLAVAPEALHDLAVFLRDDPSTRFDLFVDLAAIDRQKLTGDLAPRAGRRLQASYLLYSTSRNEHLRVKATVPESDPTLPTLTDVWPAANWFEREAWDLMGLSFRGHPSLKRLLTHGGFVGHALRKDYEAGQRWLCTEEDILQTDLAAKTDVPEDVFETVTLNFGPSHPTTHGTLRVVFRVEARDESELIGEGIHERFVINIPRFVTKLAAKRAVQ
ncbi:hypothetical protein FBQ97_07825 [Acidobacteria bacterium ACD]|nr:hypothetical protein [Acidobacteria bacterium ACD]